MNLELLSELSLLLALVVDFLHKLLLIIVNLLQVLLVEISVTILFVLNLVLISLQSRLENGILVRMIVLEHLVVLLGHYVLTIEERLNHRLAVTALARVRHSSSQLKVLIITLVLVE